MQSTHSLRHNKNIQVAALLVTFLLTALVVASCSSGQTITEEKPAITPAEEPVFGSELEEKAYEKTEIKNTQDELVFEILSLPPELHEVPPAFTKYVQVWGIHIIGTSSTPDQKILHAANVMAQYLDNDENGVPDNKRVIDALVSNNSILVMAKSEKEFENLVDKLDLSAFDSFSAQDLYGTETARSNGFDSSLEEIHHLILNYGWAEVFPQKLGQKKGSDIAKAMDIARGGIFDNTPVQYPEGAWFTYDDWTCDYRCMLTEYTYWVHTSLLGGQMGRQDEIGEEWKLETPKKVRKNDQNAVIILEDPNLELPSILPTGNYRN